MKKISLVIPVFNEEDNLARCYNRTRAVIDKLDYDFEFVFTDNHSTDGTFDILRKIAASDTRVRVIRFSKNFGYQKSILTGYVNSSGVAVLQLDCDLQDPPELIPDFLKLWTDGYKVVYGVRINRAEGAPITAIRRVYYQLISWLSDGEVPRDAGDFRLIDRCVVDQLTCYNDAQPYLRGYIANLGFRQIGLPYNREARVAGRSKFGFSNLLSLGIDGVLSQSILPLRIASYVGMVVAACTVLLSGYFLALKFYDASVPVGFTTHTLLLLYGIALNSLFLGVIGEYIGRIFRQVKRDHLVVIEETINFDKAISP
jgi:glycosyltransferase involved in cell wall biosynthesis